MLDNDGLQSLHWINLKKTKAIVNAWKMAVTTLDIIKRNKVRLKSTYVGFDFHIINLGQILHKISIVWYYVFCLTGGRA